MRAGSLDRAITLQAFSNTVAPDGTPIAAWSDAATVRAQLVEASTDEFLAGYGESDKTVAIFRIRWLDGVSTAQRVLYQGRTLNIREVKEIGRRKGLELRCEEPRA